jgi:integrase
MVQPEDPGRRRGNIRQRGSSLQVRFFAGKDPVTGRDVYLTASIAGTDKKAHKKEGGGQTRRVPHPGQQAAVNAVLGEARLRH